MSKNVIDLAPRTFVFVALPCEAKPLIQAWQLKKQAGNQAFASYRNAETAVVVSGLGKIAMAGAVAYTMAQFADAQQPILLNVGVAGHRHQPVGSCFLADKILDAESGRHFYPQLPFKLPCLTLALETSSKANTAYGNDSLYDMEASAFYEIAAKFSSGELIHCCKIVSDNNTSPIDHISEASVAAWIDGQLPVLERLLASLTGLRQSLPASDSVLYRQLLGRFHFTASNAIKLQQLLNRWKLVTANQEFDFTGINNAKDLLTWLDNQIAGQRFYL